MLQRLQSNNIPLLVFFVLVYFIGQFLAPESLPLKYDGLSVFSFMIQWPSFFESFWFVFIVSNLFVMIQGVWLNTLVSSLGMLDKTSFLLSLIYLFVMSYFNNYDQIHPQLINNFIVLYLIQQILRVMKKEQVQMEVFNIGLFVSIALLIDYSVLYFIPLLILFLALVKTEHIKLYVTFLLGAIVPLFWYGSFIFLFDGHVYFDAFWKGIFSDYIFSYSLGTSHFVAFGVLLIFSLLYAKYYSGIAVKVLLDARRALLVLGILLFASFVAYAINPVINDASMILLVLPLTVFITLIFKEIEHWLFGNLLLLLLIAGWAIKTFQLLG